MKFTINPEIFELFPHLRVGVVIGRGLKNGKRPEGLDKIIAENVKSLQEKVTGAGKALMDFPAISQWRETYRQFGVSPKKYKPTAEALLKRLLKDNPCPNISTAVDAYLAVEPLFMLPVGGYDLDTIEGDIVLRRSKGDEEFTPLGGGDPQLTSEGEVIYSDDKRVLTRNWNYRDSDSTKITEESTAILLACEAAMPDIPTQDISGTIETIADYEKKFCGGDYKTWFLDKNNPSVTID